MAQTCFTPASGSSVNCESAISGLQAISVGRFDSANKIVKTITGVATIATQFPADSLGRLEIKDVANILTETATSTSGGGMVTIAGSLVVVVKVGKDGELKNAQEVRNYLRGQLVIFLESRSGVISTLGSQVGAECLNVVYTSGDGVGNKMYTVTFSSTEYDFSDEYLLSSAALTEYQAAIVAIT
jgi:hypothetical protein